VIEPRATAVIGNRHLFSIAASRLSIYNDHYPRLAKLTLGLTLIAAPQLL